MSKFKKTLLVSAITVGTIAFCTDFCLATENVLSAIQISSDKNTYHVLLKTDEEASIKKVIENDDKMYLELSEVQASPTLSTIYNEVPNIENVVVKSSGKNTLKVILQGKNVAKSKIDFDTNTSWVSDTKKENSNAQAIEINPPIKTFAPVWSEESELQNEDKASSQSILSTLIKNLKQMDTKTMFTLMGILFIFFFGLKSLKQGNRQQTVGLSQGLKERERILAGLSAESKKLPTLNEESVYRRATTPAPSMNYGLRSYQDSQRRPDMVQKRSTSTFAKTSSASYSRQSDSTPAKAASNTLLKTRPKSVAQQRKMPPTSPHGVDSVKFLESMTKIYEKNGRADLAAGLRNNLRKAQQSL